MYMRRAFPARAWKLENAIFFDAFIENLVVRGKIAAANVICKSRYVIPQHDYISHSSVEKKILAASEKK